MLSNLTPIVSFWIPKNVEDLLSNSNILPNTFEYPYRDNFINCAKQNPEKKIVFVALTVGLTEEQKIKAKSIEKESPNILFIPLENINLGKFDFPMTVKNSVMLFSDYLKNRNTIPKQARLPIAIEIDLIRIILGLKGCEFLIEADVDVKDLPREKSIFISDFDVLIQEKIEVMKLKGGIALLEVFNRCKQLENGIVVVRNPKHDLLVSINEFIKYFFSQKKTEDLSEITTDMVFNAQIIAFTEYFSLISNEETSCYNLVDTVRESLKNNEKLILEKYGLGHYMDSVNTFHRMIKSGKFEFRYNENKIITHNNKFNSTNNWQENLYNTEAKESKLIQAFYSKDATNKEKTLDLILSKEDFKDRRCHELTDYTKFASYIEKVYKNLSKHGCFTDVQSKSIINKKLECLFIASGCIHDKLNFKVRILDCILQDDGNKNSHHLVSTLFSLPKNSSYINSFTLEKFFNVLLRYNMLNNPTDRNELLCMLAFKAEGFLKCFSKNIKELAEIMGENDKFTEKDAFDVIGCSVDWRSAVELSKPKGSLQNVEASRSESIGERTFTVTSIVS
ncbi:hypothetical protein [Wolbachia endosymbiont of Chironomus riparius]|uniref:hypothetical protein n=1 Tax=Wolbachia endosymbiont of Chironomus riparius TaxID=2883238 RepID=UPI00209D1FC8|nr:hypothetical protein [Wolbachia endosymbiont of Chironomus riparius]